MIVEYLLGPAAQAFLEVGVFVAPLLLVFGWVQWRTGGRLVEALASHRRAGPLLGALLGAMPGCGGAIVLMPLHLRGTVSFGTIVAALVATMGDSSFVLLAADPLLGVGVHALLLVVGAVVGFGVDTLGIAPQRPADPGSVRSPVPARSTVGAAAALPRLLGSGPMLAFPSLSLVGYWALVAVGMLVGAPLVAGVADGPQMAAHLGFDPVLVVGGAGIALTLAVFASSRGIHREGTHGSMAAVSGSRRGVLTEAARETAFVTIWVAVAFVVTAAIVGIAGVGLLAGEGQGAALAGRAGLVAVLLGAAVGLIPGCGPQIVLTGLYVQGALPLSVLVANALSQDGDALFPLLATHRRAALLGTAISTLPGVAVGAALWGAGF